MLLKVPRVPKVFRVPSEHKALKADKVLLVLKVR